MLCSSNWLICGSWTNCREVQPTSLWHLQQPFFTCTEAANGRFTQVYFGNSNGRASSDVNMHRALCPHSGTILTT